MSAEPVSLAVDGAIATITLADPPANALSPRLVGGLAAALDALGADPPRVVVVRSVNPGFFIAGADLKHMHGAPREVFADYLTGLRDVIERLAVLPCVSIAALDGHTLGGGFEVAAACTFRVAGPGARLGVPEIKLGLLPGAGGTQRIFRLTGRGAGLDLLLTGRSATAEEALRLGLVDRLDPDGAEAGAAELASAVAAHPRSALAAILRCADAARDRPLREGLEVELEEVLGLFDGADGREGVSAFIEKRPPRFA